MKLILLASVLLVFFLFWVLWQSSLPRLWKWLGARPVGHFPVWRQVRERLDTLARRERRPAPGLWILPEFSPNALVLYHPRAGVQIGLSEGLLRSLDAAELDAVLLLCISHGSSIRRALLTLLSLQLFPFARLLQTYPVSLQIFLSPWLNILLRIFNPPASVLRADRFSKEGPEALSAAAALQKMAVLGRKIPFRRWSFALDPLFLISPLTLDGAPFWVFLSQPSVEVRRRSLLGTPACESSAGLP